MKKIDNFTWRYRKHDIYKDLSGNYICKEVYVNDLKLPMTIVGATQKSFKDNFDRLVEKYGGLRDK